MRDTKVGRGKREGGSDKIGVAIIGCGRIGSSRAHVVSAHTSVGFLALSDIVEAKAADLAGKVGANVWSKDFREILARPEVDAVIVATGEGDHFDPVMEAIKSGRPVLVEKPIVLDLTEGKKLLDAAAKHKVDLYVGYTQRFRRRYLSTKEMLRAGYLKRVNSAFAKILMQRAVAEVVISRSPATTPTINTLTYMLDLLLWYLEGNRPTTVYAQSFYGFFKDKYNAPDATWAIITFKDGAVCTVGASWQLPDHHPGSGPVMELELFGPDGVLSIDDSHRDVMFASAKPVPSRYNLQTNLTFLASAMPGERSLGYFWGPMKDETDAFFQSVIKGIKHPALADGQQGCRVLELCLAIDKAARTGKILRLGKG